MPVTVDGDYRLGGAGVGADLLPCPFCGDSSQKMLLVEDYPGSNQIKAYSAIVCNKCDASGPHAVVRGPWDDHSNNDPLMGAAEVWNNRTD